MTEGKKRNSKNWGYIYNKGQKNRANESHMNKQRGNKDETAVGLTEM
jgi:hypothetical protein